MSASLRSFPPNFIWGTATAAYQIEGASNEDGRGLSIWDVFSHTPGKTVNGDTGDIACDHYHRYRDDVALMAELGVRSYRLSIAWPRVMPDGDGSVNQLGLDFYSRLIDELLSNDIAPLVTLYHWDLPQGLDERGGWLNRDTAQHFADYATVIADALGDRVRTFTTLNEPWCSAFQGYANGLHAPGHTNDAESLQAAHHLNLAHGRATSALRAALPASAEISVTLNLANVRAATDSDSDRAAAAHARQLSNGIFLDPILRGHYPKQLLEDTAHLTDWSFIADTDLADINVPIDFLGVNYYSPAVVTAATDQLRNQTGTNGHHDPNAAQVPMPWPGSDLAFSVPQPGPYTDMGWSIDADSLRELLVDLHRDYPEVAVILTENGAAFHDQLEPDSTVHDSERIEYLQGHIGAVHEAITAGVDVRGYYAWSLMDNFEWAWGYTKRFGLIYVDYETLERIPKDSARWYSQVIRANALPA